MVAVVSRPGVDSAYAWRLALVSAFCICLGGGSIYLPVVALKEIAFALGFRHPPHFTVWFKKQTGTTPTAYRASGGVVGA